MEFTYTITHHDVAADTVSVIYSNADPELDDIPMTFHVPNVKTNEQLTAIIIESAPVSMWGVTVIEKDLKPIVGQPQTAYRELLRDTFNPTIEAVKL